jgi:hypothetical protein
VLFAFAANVDFAGAAVAAENVNPNDESATKINRGVANLWRRNLDNLFIFSLI